MKTPRDIDSFVKKEGETIENYLYKTVFPVIEKYILINNGTTQDAQDIFQDSLLILIKKVEKDLIISCKTSTYIYAVAKNLWLQKLTKARRQLKSQENIACEQQPEYEQSIHHLENDRIQELFNSLIIKCRVNLGNDFLDTINSKGKIDRKLRWQNKQKLAKIIQTYPEFQQLNQYVHLIK